jgi:hypothetical protein
MSKTRYHEARRFSRLFLQLAFADLDRDDTRLVEGVSHPNVTGSCPCRAAGIGSATSSAASRVLEMLIAPLEELPVALLAGSTVLSMLIGGGRRRDLESDRRVLEAYELSIDESALTGESMRASKQVASHRRPEHGLPRDAGDGRQRPYHRRRHRACFAGRMVKAARFAPEPRVTPGKLAAVDASRRIE